jgi:hypothetical protein
MSYRSSYMLSEHCMGVVRPHVEQRFIFSKTSSDVMTGLVGIAVVDFRELSIIADQQQCWCNANNRTWGTSISRPQDSIE